MQRQCNNFSKDFIIKESGIRADIFLSKAQNISRTQAKIQISNAQILLNSKLLTKCSTLLQANDTLTLLPTKDSTSSTQNIKESLKIPILYEDEDLLILNKPADLIVHRTHENDMQYTLVSWLKEHKFALSHLGDSYRRGIVHRLDKGTSGAIVIAKNNKAHAHLSAQLKNRSMGRYYVCIIDSPLKDSKLIELPIIRHKKERLKYITTTKDSAKAKPAKTLFFNIATSKQGALIGAKLFSGRTHQIRVHLHAINRHILGDYFYGYRGTYTDRILLHAHFLHLLHPRTNAPIALYAPFPKEMETFITTHFKLNFSDAKNSNSNQQDSNLSPLVLPLTFFYNINTKQESLNFL